MKSEVCACERVVVAHGFHHKYIIFTSLAARRVQARANDEYPYIKRLQNNGAKLFSMPNTNACKIVAVQVNEGTSPGHIFGYHHTFLKLNHEETASHMATFFIENYEMLITMTMELTMTMVL